MDAVLASIDLTTVTAAISALVLGMVAIDAIFFGRKMTRRGGIK